LQINDLFLADYCFKKKFKTSTKQETGSKTGLQLLKFEIRQLKVKTAG